MLWFLPALALLTGLLGSGWELWMISGKLSDPTVAEMDLLIPWVQRTAGIMAIALSGGLVSGLAWSTLAARTGRVRRAERAFAEGRLPSDPEMMAINS
jgi:hypothetical protein